MMWMMLVASRNGALLPNALLPNPSAWGAAYSPTGNSAEGVTTPGYYATVGAELA
jgi:hypothetical protein